MTDQCYKATVLGLSPVVGTPTVPSATVTPSVGGVVPLGHGVPVGWVAATCELVLTANTLMRYDFCSILQVACMLPEHYSIAWLTRNQGSERGIMCHLKECVMGLCH